MFRRLSVFSAPFTSEAASAIRRRRPSRARDALAALVDRSLIQLDDDRVPARYRYLETVKAYGRARVASEGGRDARQRATATSPTSSTPPSGQRRA